MGGRRNYPVKLIETEFFFGVLKKKYINWT
jgi:hypothetical protein